MIVGSHQANYFPWLGYFDKWAKSDVFLVNDVAQLAKKSPEIRNLILLPNGKTKYLSLSVDYTGYLDKSIMEMTLVDPAGVIKSHRDLVRSAYLRTPHFDEVWEYLKPVFDKDYTFLIDAQLASMNAIANALNIKVPYIRHSELPYDRSSAVGKNEAIIAKVKSVEHANVYLSGNGAKAYMDDSLFEKNGIRVVYQEFEHPVYQQPNSHIFVTNLSAVDLLFSVGIENARNIFWENVGRQNLDEYQ